MSMILDTTEATPMGRLKPQDEDGVDSLILKENLARLGYAETVIRVSDVAKAVTENTGKPMTRQRVSMLLSSRHVSEAMLSRLAEGLGVKVSELKRKPK